MVVLPRAGFDPKSGDGQPIFNLNVALIVITSALMIVRLYVRGIMTRSLGWDDLLAVFAWGFVVCFSYLEIILVASGVGSHMEDVPKETLSRMFSLFPIDKLVFLLSGGVVRLSILAFLARIKKDRIFTICIYGASTATIIVALATFFFALFSCTPVSDVFDASKPDRQCVSNFSIGRVRWAHAILASSLNIAILGLSVWVSRTINMTQGKTVKLTLVFAVGVFAVVATITRLIFLLTNGSYTTDLTYKMVRIAPWFPLEVHAGLWCVCLATFHPLLEWDDTQRYDQYSMRKFSRSSGHDPTDDVWYRDYMTANPQVSINGPSREREPKGKRSASDDSSTNGIIMLDNERGIKMTTEFSVHVEDRANTEEGLQDRVSRTPAWSAL
ncbi:hypothetical protein DER45DRAFT_547069 [Fusarium avenaceum]|nr:hypothetical protein DER45DRAFT_547069 [Fusarium avenaceum]